MRKAEQRLAAAQAAHAGLDDEPADDGDPPHVHTTHESFADYLAAHGRGPFSPGIDVGQVAENIQRLHGAGDHNP